MSLTLYYHPLASYCWQPLIALYENDTPFKPHIVDLMDPVSAAAFKKALEMAKADRADLMIVNVISPIVPIPGVGYLSPKMYEDLRASATAWSQKELRKLIAKAKRARVRAKGFSLEGSAHEEIIRFSVLGDFIHQPVRTYSSGMFMRLALAT